MVAKALFVVLSALVATTTSASNVAQSAKQCGLLPRPDFMKFAARSQTNDDKILSCACVERNSTSGFYSATPVHPNGINGSLKLKNGTLNIIPISKTNDTSILAIPSSSVTTAEYEEAPHGRHTTHTVTNTQVSNAEDHHNGMLLKPTPIPVVGETNRHMTTPHRRVARQTARRRRGFSLRTSPWISPSSKTAPRTQFASRRL